MNVTYCGLSFEEAHAIFTADEWFANPSDRFLQIYYSEDKESNTRNFTAKKLNKSEPGYHAIKVDDALKFKAAITRKTLREEDLETDKFISSQTPTYTFLLFMFSVSLNEKPLSYIKLHLDEISTNLRKLSHNDLEMYKRYIGHLAWLKNTYQPEQDYLTKKFFETLGTQVNINDERVTLEITSEYFGAYKTVVLELQTKQPSELGLTKDKYDTITSNLAMDFDRFNNYYNAIVKSQQRGGRNKITKRRKSSTSKRRKLLNNKTRRNK